MTGRRSSRRAHERIPPLSRKRRHPDPFSFAPYTTYPVPTPGACVRHSWSCNCLQCSIAISSNALKSSGAGLLEMASSARARRATQASQGDRQASLQASSSGCLCEETGRRPLQSPPEAHLVTRRDRASRRRAASRREARLAAPSTPRRRCRANGAEAARGASFRGAPRRRLWQACIGFNLQANTLILCDPPPRHTSTCSPLPVLRSKPAMLALRSRLPALVATNARRTLAMGRGAGVRSHRRAPRAARPTAPPLGPRPAAP